MILPDITPQTPFGDVAANYASPPASAACGGSTTTTTTTTTVTPPPRPPPATAPLELSMIQESDTKPAAYAS